MTDRYFTPAETSKMLKSKLIATWPTVKFSVRLDGSSIQVAWTDGPTHKAVKAICCQYEGASFDGMTDLETNITQTVEINGETVTVRFGASYVFVNRKMSPSFKAMLDAQLFERYGVQFEEHNRYPLYWFTDLADAVSFA